MVRPGKATIYSSLPTVADMRTGAYAPGAIETTVLDPDRREVLGTRF